MNATFTFVVGLLLTGFLPAVAMAGFSSVSVFLAPLISAVVAAVAVELEVAVGGTILPWFVVLVAVVNIIALGVLLRRKSLPAWEGGAWSVVTLVVVLIFVAIPLTALRAHEVGYDGAVTWTAHALLYASGHHFLVSGLQNPAYANTDYPPLVPAVSALSFSFAGRTVLILGPELTALLNAAAVGVIATGLMRVCRPATTRARVISIAAAALICLVAFGVGGNYDLGNYAVDGFADLLWASAAVAAVLWGLVLPRSWPNLMVAWACVIAASLTKNEGLITGIAILLLIALRFQQPLLPGRASGHLLKGSELLSSWGRCALMWLGPALPAIIWVLEIHALGVQDSFFEGPRNQSISLRAHATADAVARHQVVLPVALVVAVLGCLWFVTRRRRAQLGNPVWLWLAWGAGTIAVSATYVLGNYEIHTWLQESIDRTMLFSKLVLFVDIACWALIALTELLREPMEQGDRSRTRAEHALMGAARPLIGDLGYDS